MFYSSYVDFSCARDWGHLNISYIWGPMGFWVWETKEVTKKHTYIMVWSNYFHKLIFISLYFSIYPEVSKIDKFENLQALQILKFVNLGISQFNPLTIGPWVCEEKSFKRCFLVAPVNRSCTHCGLRPPRTQWCTLHQLSPTWHLCHLFLKGYLHMGLLCDQQVIEWP